MLIADVERSEDERKGGWIFFVEDRVSKEQCGEENIDRLEVDNAVDGWLGEGLKFVDQGACNDVGEVRDDNL